MDEETTKNSILFFLKLPHKVTILQNTSTFSNLCNNNRVHFYIYSFYNCDIIDIYGSFFLSCRLTVNFLLLYSNSSHKQQHNLAVLEFLNQFYIQHTNITVQMLVFKYCFF